MGNTLQLAEITMDVQRKDIKNVHLSVYPPTGRVRISAPSRMSLDKIRLFAISKIDWIRQQQKRQREQERETQREYIDRESHYVWGRRVLLKIVNEDAAPTVELHHTKLHLRVRSGTEEEAREAIVATWYRLLLRSEIPRMIATWEPRLNVKVSAYYVQQMKTKWGSCNPATRTIRLNTELAKKPKECLEYIVVHEMVHMIERTHGARFVSLMDNALPDWRHTREMLNRLPASHQTWTY